MTLLLEKEIKDQTRFKHQPDKMHNSLMKANQVVSDGRIVISDGRIVRPTRTTQRLY